MQPDSGNIAKGFLAFLAVALLCSAFPRTVTAQTAGTPVYDQGIDRDLYADLRHFLAISGYPAQTINIAAVNLNDDHTPEMIVRQTNAKGDCPRRSGCRFFVLADADGQYILLGHFEGFSIEIDSRRTDGVSDLLLFRSPANDFAAQRCVWTPEQSAYTCDPNEPSDGN